MKPINGAILSTLSFFIIAAQADVTNTAGSSPRSNTSETSEHYLVGLALTENTIALDTFNRRQESGWGMAEFGGSWSNTGTTAVEGDIATMSAPAGKTSTATLVSLSGRDLTSTADVMLDALPINGTTEVHLCDRITSTGDLRAILRFRSSGAVSVLLARKTTSGVLSILTSPAEVASGYTPGTPLHVMLKTSGAFPATIQAKVWVGSSAEPAGWSVSTTTSAGAQSSGKVGILLQQGASVSNGAASLSVDNLQVFSKTLNQRPSAAFQTSVNAQLLRVDGYGSVDPDGSITAYNWVWGDGTSSTTYSPVTSHTYANYGSYAVQLTVTDNLGRTASTSVETAVGPSEQTPERDVALHPFTSWSPWNTSLGSDAAYEEATDPATANFLSGSPAVNSARWSVAVYQATTEDPLATVVDTKLTASSNDDVTHQIHVPVNAYPTGGTDGHVAVIDPDGKLVWELYAMTKIDDMNWTSGRIVATDLLGDGLPNGARASATSILAGLIRADELDSGSIHHALMIGVPSSILKSGPVWPAHMEDTNGSALYSGLVPMGSLVALDPNVDITSLGLSPKGLAIARALQNYGGYVVINAATVTLSCELACDQTDVAELAESWSFLYPYMRVVTNSSATTVGGGGARREEQLPMGSE
ncbi:MAG: PKD domain-containing protein [Candidatus Thiodiazotropha sp.]